MLNIGVFGGSFDPIHLEHIQIIKVVFKEFAIDKVIVVPAYKPPHKKTLNVSAIHRLNMLNCALESMKNIMIDTFEINSNRIVYTIETLDYLQGKYSNANIRLIIGADSFNNLNKWKKSDYIAKKYGFIVVNRQNIKIDMNSKFIKYSKFSNFTGTISSTQIRENIKKGMDVRSLLNKNVLDYIKKYELYK